MADELWEGGTGRDDGDGAGGTSVEVVVARLCSAQLVLRE